MPLGILTVIVLAVILFGITTTTKSAAVGAAGAFVLAFHARTLDWKRTKEAVFLTPRPPRWCAGCSSARRCSRRCSPSSAAGAAGELGVLALRHTPVQFMILSQAIIFVLGWPLEWTEIIIIFVPISCRC